MRYGRPGKIWPESSDCFLFQNDWFFLGVIWAYNFLWKKLVRAKTNQIENILFRDLRTKTDRSRTERFGPVLGPNRTRTKKFWKSRTGPDQDQKNFKNYGPNRTRTKQILKISDQLGPIGPRTWRSVDPWSESKLTRNICFWSKLSMDLDLHRIPCPKYQ